MGSSITLTPVFTSYGTGMNWSDLGANETAAKDCVSNVFSNFSTGLQSQDGSDHSWTVDVSYGSLSGNVISSGAQSSELSTTVSYATFRGAVQAISGKNSDQTSAWADANLPSSHPFSGGSNVFMSSANAAILGLTTVADNTGIGAIGVHQGILQNFDVNGLGSNPFYAWVFHELSEVMGCIGNTVDASPRSPMDYFTYSAAGVRNIDFGTARYLSHDGGTTDIADLAVNLGSDGGDYATYGDDARDAVISPISGVSRDSSTPARARDWRNFSLIGYKLSASGLSWAGLTGSAPTCSVNPAISGTLKTGNTISVSNGTWTNGPDFTYQWKKNGSTIGGATSSTYTPSNSDRDALFTCAVTGTNVSGNATATSASVGPWLVNTYGTANLRH